MHFPFSIRLLSLTVLLLLSLSGYSQDTLRFFEPSSVYNKKRTTAVIVTASALYAGSFVALNELWYEEHPRTSFHFFNDNSEWLQMDKAGHIASSYYIGRIGLNMLKWSGVEQRKAVWYGGAMGSIYLTAVEVLDGFSKGWGFSPGDIAANTIGSALVIGQELGWKEQRISLKYSFNESGYAKYRPGLLGTSYTEKLVKDYNGQTYWMSVNIHSFLREGSGFPAWLNVAVGYGAEGMTGGRFNPPYIDADGNQLVFDRYRQYYLSLDVDLSRIKTRSHFLKACFETFGFLKIPAPAVQFSKQGVEYKALHW